VDVRKDTFLTSALVEDRSGQLHVPDRFTPGDKDPGAHVTGCWVGPRVDLDYEKNLLLPGLKHQPLGHPVAITTAPPNEKWTISEKRQLKIPAYGASLSSSVPTKERATRRLSRQVSD
jgi:hypothetical protein